MLFAGLASWLVIVLTLSSQVVVVILYVSLGQIAIPVLAEIIDKIRKEH